MGFVGFDAVKSERAWDVHDADLLRLLAALLEAAYERLIRERERQVALDQLAIARDEARTLWAVAHEANLARSRFIATVTHEIRTPMHVVLGMARELREQPLQGEARRYADAIDTAGRALGELLDDVLEVSRIDAGKVNLQRVPVAVSELVSDCRALFEQEAHIKRLLLIHRVGDSMPPRVMSDPVKLRQILVNLVSNAVKYSDQGVVTIAADFLPSDAISPSSRLRLTVADEGIGMSADTISRLYEPFYREGQPLASSRAGTGLGMTVVKMLVEVLGGEIFVESTLGEGSRIVVSVPIDECSEDEVCESNPAEAGAPGPVSRCVLVAEDDPLNRSLLEVQLRNVPVQICWTVNGREAFEACQKQHFDVILMDCRMPEMSGWEATRRIRALGGWCSAVPIVAMTAGTAVDERKACLEAGMTHFLPKPFRREQLLDALDAA